MKALALALAALALAGCGGSSKPAPDPGLNTTVAITQAVQDRIDADAKNTPAVSATVSCQPLGANGPFDGPTDAFGMYVCTIIYSPIPTTQTVTVTVSKDGKSFTGIQ